MEFFPSRSTFLEIGPFNIQYYALFILTGAILAYYLVLRKFVKMGYKKEIAEDFFLYVLPLGIVGARIWYVLFKLDYYLKYPVQIFYIHKGGLAIQGGVIVGVLFGIYYFKKHKISIVRMADLIIPHILLAQAIGRWGNFMNQEAYGREVTESYFNYFPNFIKEGMFIDGKYYEPTFLYESIANFTGFLLIVYIVPKLFKLKKGDQAYLYFFWYGITRFFIEGLRSDSLMFFGLRTAQLVSIVFALFGALGLSRLFDRFVCKKPTILFDLDGTVLNTDKLIIETYRHLFAKYRPDFDFNEEEQKSVLGPSLKEKLPQYFEQDYQELYDEYQKFNLSNHEKYVTLYPNLRETLEQLKKEGYKLGIVSTKGNNAINYGLKTFDLEKYFDVVVGADDVEIQKPDPAGIIKACEILNVNQDNLIYIGDNGNDILAGKNAYAYTIGVSWTIKGLDYIKSFEPDDIIDDYQDLLRILKENRSWNHMM